MKKKTIINLELAKRTEFGTLLKPVIWHPAARAEVQGFPDEIKLKLGFLIYRLQRGDTLGMPQSRPMSSVGAGVFELRPRSKDGIFRVFYLLKLEDGVCVFHAFQKKTEATPDKEIKLGQKRLKEMLES